MSVQLTTNLPPTTSYGRREKVKRRRAEAAKEAAKEEAAKTSAEAKADEKKQPSLVDLSRDLPSGWQVIIYLDIMFSSHVFPLFMSHFI